MKNPIPSLGFGTWQLTGPICTQSVSKALEIGYRHIDTADIYQNHQEVGAAITQSGIKREDIFLTSKVWRQSLAPEKVIDDCDRFLQELNTDYLDLLLIHWPNRSVPITDTLTAMQTLKSDGKVKHIGVSNFTKELLTEIPTDIEIFNHQFEFHPSLQQSELIDYCFQRGISVSAYSPLGQGEDLALPEVKEIAKSHNVGPAEVILAWILQRGLIAIVRSSNPQHIEANWQSQNLKLTSEEIELLNGLDQNNRTVSPGFAPF